MIASALLLLVVGFFLSSLDSASSASRYQRVRGETLDRLRLAAARFSKDARQAIEVSVADQDRIVMDTYVGTTAKEVTWRAVADPAGGYNLERTVTGSGSEVLVVSVLYPEVFSYYGLRLDVTQVNKVRLVLEAQPDPKHPTLVLSSAVEMRNAG